MRLLNTTTLTLHSFFGNAVPEYAILSHRWDDEEVLFQDLESGRGPSMPGYHKIQGCCAQARKDGWQFAWIDSCCIDKSSSTELSEAINSMYQWYKDSVVCYAYLSDVNFLENGLGNLSSSAWFSRGWTLQELLAPENLVFFDCAWTDIGTKRSLRDTLSKITGIPTQRLFEIGDACIAERMSWAANRRTTRIEDEAYCLMGLFNVNMPLLYGEGNKAFERLQLEIIKESDDESFLVWEAHDNGMGVLAPYPSAFFPFGDLVRKRQLSDDQEYFDAEPHPFTMTNKGLHISLFMIPSSVLGPDVLENGGPNDFVALLYSLKRRSDGRSPAIQLQVPYSSDNLSIWHLSTLLRKYEESVLFLDLSDIRFRCQEGLNNPVHSTVAGSGGISLSPITRQIYIRHWKFFTQTFQGTKIHCHSVAVKIKSLPKYRFKTSKLLSFEPDEIFRPRWHQETHSLLILRPAKGFPFFLKLFSLACFTNSTTNETIALILREVSDGSPLLSLLTWDSTDFSDDTSVKSHCQSITKAPGFDLTDRISLPLKNGMSVSAAVRKIGGRDMNEFSVYMVIDPKGLLRWPPRKGHPQYISESV